MFDLDGTLIETKSGNKFPKNSADWDWIDDRIVRKLNAIVENDSRAGIIIISNQKVAGSNEEKKTMIKNKLKNVFKNLINLLPKKAFVCLYASTEANKYRKPSTGIFEEKLFPMIDNESKIIYVGDAAGREDDFSDSDRKFAYNVQMYLNYESVSNKITFFTPEEYFKLDRVDSVVSRSVQWRGFNPKKYMHTLVSDSSYIGQLDRIFDAPGFTLVVLVGPQAVGKSTYAKREFIAEDHPGFLYFGLDAMPSKANYDKTFIEQTELARKKNRLGVVVDATNPSIVNRDRWLKHAELFDNMFILIFPGSNPRENGNNSFREYLKHMNTVRSRITGEKEIPDIAYTMFYKKYQAPKKDEFPDSLKGDSDIINIPIIPMTFPDKKHLMYFMQWS